MKKTIPAVIAVGALALSACGSGSGTTSSASTAAGAGATTTTAGSSASSARSTGGAAPNLTLTETGSSLLYPFLQTIAPSFVQQYPTIKFQPAAGGSGKGISDAASHTTSFGGSDAYLSASQRAQYNGLEDIPIVISSQDVNFNLSGVKALKLTGNLLAEMYQGKITKWNDPQIAALNPGVALPPVTVVPIHRSDSSGDTFLFSSFLTSTNSAWANGPGEGTTVSWPSVSGEATANGNPGMVQACGSTPGCIAYIGISAESSARSAGLGVASLQNKAGSFVNNTSATVASAVSAGSGSVPSDLAASLIYEPGAQSYPIVNFEYTIEYQRQASAADAAALKDFLDYAIASSGGSQTQYLNKEDFQALPAAVLPKVQAAINAISG